MSILESIGKLPVWKVGILLVLIFSFIMVGIEDIFVIRIFHLINQSIVNSDKIFKEESGDVDRDYQRFNERQEYDRALSDLNEFNIFDHRVIPRQDYICDYKTINKKLEKFYGLAYVKHNGITRKWVTQEIANNKKAIDEAIVKGDFDPSRCKDVM